MFLELNLDAPLGGEIKLKNITFNSCRTKYTFRIGQYTVLENVKFTEFNCGDAMRICSDHALLKGVVIEGRKYPKALFIRPSISTEGGNGQFSYPDYSLDISNFYGEVDIVGVNTDNVKIDPDRHVKFKVDRFDGVDWEALGIIGFSLIKIILRRTNNYGAKECIVDIASLEGNTPNI